MQCADIETVHGCRTRADGTKETVVIHYEYRMTAAGAVDLIAVRYTNEEGTPITLAPGESVAPGACDAALPFQWGCVRDVVPGPPQDVCNHEITQEVFTGSSYTNTYMGSPASGQYTFRLVFTTAADATRLYNAATLIQQTGVRAHETVGPYSSPTFQFDFHPGMIVSAVQIDPLTVDYTLDVGPAQDNPSAPIQSPCVFTEPDYATNNAFLNAAYAGLTPGNPVAVSEFTFDIQQFTVVQVPGPDVITTTPVKVLQRGDSIELRDLDDALYTVPATATLHPGACPANDFEVFETCYRLTTDVQVGQEGDVLVQRILVPLDPITGLPDISAVHIMWWNESQGEFITLMDTNGNALMGQPFGVDPNVMTTCEQYNNAAPVSIQSGGLTIAGAVRAGTPEFASAPSVFNTSAVPNALQSVTVTVHDAENGLVGQTPSQIVVATPDGSSIALMSGETKTWSVVRDQDAGLSREFNITANGMAYATITYTHEA